MHLPKQLIILHVIYKFSLEINKIDIMSHFGGLKKRENSNEGHKSYLRKKLKNIKESYIGYGGNKIEKYEFPKMSETEFKKFQKKWFRKRKRERIKNVIVISLSIVLGIIIAIYFRIYL